MQYKALYALNSNYIETASDYSRVHIASQMQNTREAFTDLSRPVSFPSDVQSVHKVTASEGSELQSLQGDIPPRFSLDWAAARTIWRHQCSQVIRDIQHDVCRRPPKTCRDLRAITRNLELDYVNFVWKRVQKAAEIAVIWSFFFFLFPPPPQWIWTKTLAGSKIILLCSKGCCRCKSSYLPISWIHMKVENASAWWILQQS